MEWWFQSQRKEAQQKAMDLEEKVERLEGEARMLAATAADTLAQIKHDMGDRALIFQRAYNNHPHKDHEQRAIGYREVDMQLGIVIKQLKATAAGEKGKRKVDLAPGLGGLASRA